MSTPDSKKLLFISWAENCSRSDALARLLQGTSKMVYVRQLGSNYVTVWLKYLLQGWSTWKLLKQEKPDVVMVMVPPVFACLPVYLYCRTTRAGFITDNHTAAFAMSRWKPLLFLNAWLFRRAVTNIVTNAHLAKQVESWRAPVTVIGDLPVQFEKVSDFPLNGKFTITVICSFNPDEPLDSIWQSARELSDVDFYVTGRLKDAPAHYIEARPSNLHLTDFLADDEYAGLIRDSHGVMVLTTRDHTMQRGAYEAVALGTPVITSDWPVLRETFAKGALFVNNSPQSIVTAVRTLRESWSDYKAAVQAQRHERLKVWHQRKNQLLAAIASRLDEHDH